MSQQKLAQETLGEFADYGFSLNEQDDHITELYFKDKRIARYNATKVTTQILQEGCRNFLSNISKYS